MKRDGKRDNKDPFYGMRPSDKEINKGKSEPAMPIAWVKDYQLPEGKKGRAFNTTMGAATDIVSEGTRKMICNGMYWAMGMEDKIPDQGTQVGIVGEFKPTAFGFGTFRKNLKVSDFEMKAKQPAARRDGIGPRADIPQLKVLNHFAGRWVEEVTIGDDTVTARGKAEWVLGGTHLRSEFEIDTEGAKTHHMAVMGWDPVRETYVSYMFSNSGAPVVFRGRWDADTKTFRQSSFPDRSGITTHSTSKVVDDDEIQWTVVMKDQSGEVTGTLTGVDRRAR